MDHKHHTDPAQQHGQANATAQGFAQQQPGRRSSECWVGVLQDRGGCQRQCSDRLKEAKQGNASTDAAQQQQASVVPQGVDPSIRHGCSRQCNAHNGSNQHDLADGNSSSQLLDAHRHQAEGQGAQNQGPRSLHVLALPPGRRLFIHGCAGAPDGWTPTCDFAEWVHGQCPTSSPHHRRRQRAGGHRRCGGRPRRSEKERTGVCRHLSVSRRQQAVDDGVSRKAVLLLLLLWCGRQLHQVPDGVSAAEFQRCGAGSSPPISGAGRDR